MFVEHEDEYTDSFVAGLEWMWGEGFLSPGGPSEVAAIVQGSALAGRHVLDIGAGAGGIDILLATEHGAAHVLGIDVEAPLVARAGANAERAGVADRVRFQLVEPGAPLPFPDGSFDAVFSKDAIVHVDDKPALYKEIHRVLEPGGVLAMGDWFRDDGEQVSDAMRAWFEVLGITLRMASLSRCAAWLRETGFEVLHTTDRNAWYCENVEQELASISGDNYLRLVERIGEEAAAQRVRSTSAKREVVRRGELRPGHLRARKPP